VTFIRIFSKLSTSVVQWYITRWVEAQVNATACSAGSCSAWDTETAESTPRDSFSFLNRADGIVWQRIRDKLNDWYAALPDDDESVRRRFRKADPRQHYAAWWELYMHALLRALGFDVTVHPDVPGTDGHPDFLAERGKESFYVEAVTVF
jgi:hypothetical protein